MIDISTRQDSYVHAVQCVSLLTSAATYSPIRILQRNSCVLYWKSIFRSFLHALVVLTALNCNLVLLTIRGRGSGTAQAFVVTPQPPSVPFRRYDGRHQKNKRPSAGEMRIGERKRSEVQLPHSSLVALFNVPSSADSQDSQRPPFPFHSLNSTFLFWQGKGGATQATTERRVEPAEHVHGNAVVCLNGLNITTPAPNGFNGASVVFNGVSAPPVTVENKTVLNIITITDKASDIVPTSLHWTELISQGWSILATPSTAIFESVFTEYDLQQIEQYWERLLPSVNYLGTEQVAKIYQALCVAYRAHRGQMRKSGEPFIIHPVEVSLLLANLKMDAQTVIAGLLHDTVEDTELTFPQIEALFGSTVRSIVEGETKVSKLPKLAMQEHGCAEQDEQAENLRQMFVAMTDDYRIIIVKLADRLHNMRTLRHMKPHKQIKISKETLDIFAPLAHRMGIWQFKSELEDTAFMYLFPKEYKALNRRLRQHQNKFREALDRSQEIMQRKLDADATLQQQAERVLVYGRTKEIYSLWHKMTSKGIDDLDHIGDVVALRIIITPGRHLNVNTNHDDEDNSKLVSADRGVWLCYHVLSLVQHLPGFQPVPTRIKDYISFPKPNGYQSLHTALIFNGQTIEVQIRTKMMHQVAEYGMASHWAYTERKRRQQRQQRQEASSTVSSYTKGDNDLYNTPWLSSIKEWQNDQISSRDFVDSVRRELLGKRVFVFLRNGKILNLSRGATAVDAAFQIHIEVGLNMHGVEINGKPVPFSYELQNGDVVSILTGRGGKPSTDWMLYAKSRSTRSKLRAYFRSIQKGTAQEAGQSIVLNYLRMHTYMIQQLSCMHLTLQDLDRKVFEGENAGLVMPATTQGVAAHLPGKTKYNDINELLFAVGKYHNQTIIHRVVSQLFEVSKKNLVPAEESKQIIVPSSVAVATNEQQQIVKQNGVTDVVEPIDQQTINNDRDFLLMPLEMTKDYYTDNVKNTNNAFTRDTKVQRNEYADPEHICRECLPVYGDQIIGTRRPDKDATTIVHRIGCTHALRAVHLAAARKRQFSPQSVLTDSIFKLASSMRPKGSSSSTSITPGDDAFRTQKIDSVSLRMQRCEYIWKRYSRPKSRYYTSTTLEVPVKLVWSEWGDDSTTLFLVEIVIHAVDRKLLFADCSEVVSKIAEIVQSRSSSNDEHAIFIFLVKVTGLDQLQTLMDQLLQTQSVMSVERRFGSVLL